MKKYAKKLYLSLLGIKKYYEKEFNEDNTNSIDDYIEFFDYSYDNFIRVLIPNTKVRKELLYEEVVAGNDLYKVARFIFLEDIPKDDKTFVFNENGKVAGFTDKRYEKISRYAKQLFMIEKLCSFTTRKFWKNEITNYKDFDLNKPYKILVKCVFPGDWRKEKKSKSLENYMQDKTYHSTSLIDQTCFYNTFLSFLGKYAMLLVDYNDENYICASPSDDYSEEVINNKNLLRDKKVFSDVLLQDEVKREDKNHKFFAEAVECETPKSILNNIRHYSEVNFKDIKPKAVIAPNEMSIEFAKQVAKEYGDIPVILKEEM